MIHHYFLIYINNTNIFFRAIKIKLRATGCTWCIYYGKSINTGTTQNSPFKPRSYQLILVKVRVKARTIIIIINNNYCSELYRIVYEANHNYYFIENIGCLDVYFLNWRQIFFSKNKAITFGIWCMTLVSTIHIIYYIFFDNEMNIL